MLKTKELVKEDEVIYGEYGEMVDKRCEVNILDASSIA
jgi:hypothetical protein